MEEVQEEQQAEALPLADGNALLSSPLGEAPPTEESAPAARARDARQHESMLCHE